MFEIPNKNKPMFIYISDLRIFIKQISPQPLDMFEQNVYNSKLQS